MFTLGVAMGSLKPKSIAMPRITKITPMIAVAYLAFTSNHEVQNWVTAPMAKNTTMKPADTMLPTSSARLIGAFCALPSAALTPRKYMR